MTQQNETVVVGSCPKCGGPAQFIGNDKEIVEYRHVDLSRAAIENFFEELATGVGFSEFEKEAEFILREYLRELDKKKNGGRTGDAL
jgi:hypothetical protein